MSYLKKCDKCDEIAQAFCECSSPPSFFCDYHASNHRSHSFREIFIHLSPNNISILREAYNKYQKSIIRRALDRKNKKIENLLKKVLNVEKEYSREIESILKERSVIEEFCAFRGLPVLSDNPILSLLAQLRASFTFFLETIYEQLLSFRSSMPPLSSSLQPLSTPQWTLSEEFQAHTERIISLAVSDCESYLASGSEDHSIKIWDLDSLECIYTLYGHMDKVNSVAFWGSKLISGSNDRTIKIWEGDGCLETLYMHSEFVESVCVSSSKIFLASGGGDKNLVVYNLEKNETVHSIEHSDIVFSIVFSPSDEQFVSGCRDAIIRVWKTETGELLNSLKGHSDCIICLCFSGPFLVSSSSDKKIKIWDLEKEKAKQTIGGHSSDVVSVDGSHNFLVSLGKDNWIGVWDRKTAECIQSLEGHGDYSHHEVWYAMDIKLLRGEEYIISGGKDKIIRIYKRVG